MILLDYFTSIEIEMQSHNIHPDTNNDFNQRGLATLIGIGYGVPIGQ